MKIDKKRKITSIMISLFLLSIISLSITSAGQYSTYELIETELSTNSINDNTPPNPPIINGPSSGKVGANYDYTFTLTDPDEDDYLSILEVDFGNSIEGSVKKNCEKPWENGTIITMTHQWNEPDEYEIRARVMDSIGDWSNWSDPYVVSMPKYKQSSQIVESMQERYPHLFGILQKILLLI